MLRPIDDEPAFLKSTWRRRRLGTQGFAYAPGRPSPTPTFARASAATFAANVPDIQFSYVPGASLATATFTRTSAASYTQNA